MKYNETELLIKKYLNGETTVEEERRLALEVSREGVPDDWKIIAGMLGELTVDEALFDQMMAKRKQKPRLIKLWPWLAAACVAALLIVFLGPPRDNVSIQPQTKQIAEVKNVTPHTTPQEMVKPNVEELQDMVKKPVRHRKERSSKRTSKEMAIDVPTPENSHNELTKVDESDIALFDDPQIQFAEQAKALRERGNLVIQRVSMNGLPSNNYQLNDL